MTLNTVNRARVAAQLGKAAGINILAKATPKAIMANTIALGWDVSWAFKDIYDIITKCEHNLASETRLRGNYQLNPEPVCKPNSDLLFQNIDKRTNFYSCFNDLAFTIILEATFDRQQAAEILEILSPVRPKARGL